MTNRWECCVGSGCRVGGALWGSLLRPLRLEEPTVWAGLLVSFPGCCETARQRDSETRRNSAWTQPEQHTHVSVWQTVSGDPRSCGWEKIRLSVPAKLRGVSRLRKDTAEWLCVCEELHGLVHLDQLVHWVVITSSLGSQKKKKNLQRGVLGQHRQVFSVLEFYSLQGVLWGFVTLQTVYVHAEKAT